MVIYHFFDLFFGHAVLLYAIIFVFSYLSIATINEDIVKSNQTNKMIYPQRATPGFYGSKIFFVIFLFFILSERAFAQQNSGSKTTTFRAAVVKVDISPNSPKQLLGYGARLSTGIHDRIYHRIIALDDGDYPVFSGVF